MDPAAHNEPPLNVLVLTCAGKPVFATAHARETEGEAAALAGTLQAVVALFAHTEGRAIRTMHTASLTVVFLAAGPLVLAAWSSGAGDSETQLQRLLACVLDHLLSVTSLAQIERIFDQHPNYDLRLLLAGTDAFLSTAVSSFRSSPATHLLESAAHLALPPKRRAALCKLLSTGAPSHLVYSILVAAPDISPTVVACYRQKATPLFAKDILVLMNLLATNIVSFKTGIEAWTPVCLPNHNSAAFLNMYVKEIPTVDAPPRSAVDREADELLSVEDDGISYLGSDYNDRKRNCDLFLVCFSKNREGFFDISEYRKTIENSLKSKAYISQILGAFDSHPCILSDLGIPRLRHFVCRAKRSGQHVECRKAPPYTDSQDYQRLYQLYSLALEKLHPVNNATPAKFIFLKADQEGVVAMTTKSYDLFAAFSPLILKKDAEEDIMSLYRWVKKMDYWIFSE
ncbi:Vacuolar fusion protein mon1b [Entophlyctis luteolus]|nr:Vacuolar fusion protein mon1b [Entophlyctis luteolus]